MSTSWKSPHKNHDIKFLVVGLATLNKKELSSTRKAVAAWNKKNGAAYFLQLESTKSVHDYCLWHVSAYTNEKNERSGQFLANWLDGFVSGFNAMEEPNGK